MSHPPVLPPISEEHELRTLELRDGLTIEGYGFGANKPTAGELVFQTGMVGYPESLTDPSYEGQILVITFPLVGNYGVPSRETLDSWGLSKNFESKRIHVAGLVVASYTEEYSHYLASSSLDAWLKEYDVPAIYAVDTRGLTQHIREDGSVLARLGPNSQSMPEWWDPNAQNLVAHVSTKEPKTFKPHKPVVKADGTPLRFLVLDVGLKFNQIRCLVSRGVEITVLPWDSKLETEGYDGLFISNGPGDPAKLGNVVEQVRNVLESKKVPVFGICLGHQLIARAAGAQTTKLKFGNRGQNIPATNLVSGRCYITSQNHGYAVEASTLTNGWRELFVNANDGSNEGIYHESLPFFSVQFHPEASPGPHDTEFLFDTFIETALDFAATKMLKPVYFPSAPEFKRVDAKKVLILGSGGLSIGQAGEFDYSGSQAIKALKEEGLYTVLINPNIATIQTSKGLADKVYFLPVTPDFVRKVIKYECPDSIYVTFGGQTALSVGIALKDELKELGVKVLGTPVDTVITTEDRELFANAMAEINEKCATSVATSNWEEARDAAEKIGYPVIARAAYALGGLGSGFADNESQLKQLCDVAFATSPQVLVERSMKGWKEIEYEVVRDAYDNCITVCNMENFDPLGIHTGDSIVVAPSQTLSDEDYNMLRTTAVNVIRHLGVVGECNIQYALNPDSKEYCIIEVNARLSRSSALASKATGYPLAFVAAKLGLGIPLYQVKNSVTKSTCACFEPSLDYVVVKIPRWDLKKFTRVSKELSSSMKSVGEVMSIGRTFEEAIQKAIRSTDYHNLGFAAMEALMSIDIDSELQTPSDQRLFAIANALSSGYTVEQVWSLTKIDRWFLNKLKGLIDFTNVLETQPLDFKLMREAKQLGFDDRQIARAKRSNEMRIRDIRTKMGIHPWVKKIDTVAAEFPAQTNYLYMTYNADKHDIDFEDHGAMVLGSGVYRIGSSVEFDWCAVRTVRTLRSLGHKTIMVNYNPETVSTDYDEADRLYFEVINLERVLDIYELETSSGVVVSMGGQTSNNIALALQRANVNILGTSPDMIDRAENRYKFSRMLDSIGVDQPEWKELTSFEEAEQFAERVSYPVLVRPSYVLSGAAMNTVYSRDDLASYLNQAVAVSQDYPVVITKYIEGAKEIEMDAVARDGEMVMHVVSEHVENAGVHSGDATLIVPPQDLAAETVQRIVEATAKIGDALNVSGPYNIQFIAKDNDIKVIECNVRASRSFPFVSKATGTDLIEIATQVVAGAKVQPYPSTTLDRVAVKVPQFSFSRLSGADPVLGVEMASTGEVACYGKDKYEAYLKALIASGIHPPPARKNILLSIGSYKEKMEILPYVERLQQAGYGIYATAGTTDFLVEYGIKAKYLDFIADDAEKAEYSLAQYLSNNRIDLYVNLPSSNRFRRPANYMSKGYKTRRMAVDYAVPLVTNVKNAKLLFDAMLRTVDLDLPVTSVDAQLSHNVLHVPGGLVSLTHCIPDTVGVTTTAAVKHGFTTNLIVGEFKSERQILAAGKEAAGDFFLLIEATHSNVGGNEGRLWIPQGMPLTDIAAHLQAASLVVTDVAATELASLLLLSALHQRRLHVSNIRSVADLQLVEMSRQRGLPVTADICLLSLLLAKEDAPDNLKDALPSRADQDKLRSAVADIDMITVTSSRFTDFSAAVPIVAAVVSAGWLTPEKVIEKLAHAPRRIFGLVEDLRTSVDIDLDRTAFEKSPLGLKSVTRGTVERVEFEGKLRVLEDKLLSPIPGRDLAEEVVEPVAQPSSPVVPTSPVSVRRSVSRPSFTGEQPKPQASRQPASRAALIESLRRNPFLRKSVTSVHQFTRRNLHELFDLAQEMRLAVERKGGLDLLQGRVLALMFYEPSTRTQTSFDAAMQRLGGRVIPVSVSNSSVKKGETLQDTLRTLASYCDSIVLRHPDPDSIRVADRYLGVPVINGGNGPEEHPTQAFLDLYTIREELGSVNGLTITFMGDLKYGRTVHSLTQLLAYYNIKVQLVAPKELELPQEFRDLLSSQGKLGREAFELTDEILADTDVLYCTRVQQERFASQEQYNRLKDTYRVDNSVLARCKNHMCVMHPLPRNAEIAEEVDFDHRAAYFRQMRYGLYVRMALLLMVTGVDF